MLQTLANAGLMETYNAWARNNEELLANSEAALKFQESIAELAETVQPIVTLFTEVVTEFIEKFNELDPMLQEVILVILALTALLSPVTSGIAGIASNIGIMIPLIEKAAGVISALFAKIAAFVSANPITLIIAAIVLLVGLIAEYGDEIKQVLQGLDDFLQNIFAKDWTEVFGPVLGGALNSFFDIVKGIWDNVKNLLDGIIDFIQAVFTGDWEKAWEAVKQIFVSAFGALAGIAKAPLNGIITLVNLVIGGINSLIEKLNNNKLTEFIDGLGIDVPDIPTIPTIPMLAKGGVLRRGSAIVGESGPEILTYMPGKAVVTPLTGQRENSIGADIKNTGSHQNTPIELLINIDGKRFAHATYNAYRNEGNRRGGSLVNV